MTTKNTQEFKDFSAWSYHQVMVLDHTLTSTKDENGRNISWKNNTTGEVFTLPKKDQE